MKKTNKYSWEKQLVPKTFFFRTNDPRNSSKTVNNPKLTSLGQNDLPNPP